MRNKCAKLLLVVFSALTIAFPLSMLVTSSTVQASATESEWPVPGQNQARTFYIDSEAPDTPHLLWKFKMGDVPSGSCIVADGKVFQGCYVSGDVYAVNMSTGDQIWHNNLNNTAYWVAYYNDRIYTTGGTLPHDPVTRVTGDLHVCLNASTGEILWTHQVPITPPYMTGVIPGSYSVYEGKVYKPYGGGLLIWNETTGDLLGHWFTGDSSRYTAVYQGDIYSTSTNYTDYTTSLYRGDPETQTVIWKSSTLEGVSWSMCAASAEHVYVAAFNYADPGGMNKLYRIDTPTGTVHWGFAAEGAPYSVAIAYNRLYFGTTAGNVYCIDKFTGAFGHIWKFTEPGAIYTDLAIADEKVFFGSLDGYVYALDAWTGELIWKYRTEGPVTGSPCIVDGKMYIAGNDRYIYCFGPGPASSISLSAPSIKVGESLTMEGELVDEAGVGIAGANVTLRCRAAPMVEWTDIATVTTASDGGYSYQWTPSYDGYYDISASYEEPEMGGYASSCATSTVRVAPTAPEVDVDLTPITDDISSLKDTVSSLQSTSTTYLIAIAVLVVIVLALSGYIAVRTRR